MMKGLWILFASILLQITNNGEEIVAYQKELDHQLFGAYYKQAEEKVDSMSLEQQVGQMFLARMNEDKVFYELENFYPGGYVLFAQDFANETKKSISARLASYHEKSMIPLIMAVDEEGEIVTRVSRYPAFRKSRFPTSQVLYRQGGFEEVERVEKEKIALLRDSGLNLNLAPVADVSSNPQDFIYKRSFGQDAAVTSEYIKKVVHLDYENQFASCLKHFPGYGNNADTHTGMAVDERSYDSFTENDYLPFQAGILEKVPTILVSHNIVKSMDDTLPASLSPKVHQELREKLGFTGLILTDDISMGAIANYSREESSAVLAVLAGNDLIITSDFEHDYKDVLEACKSGKITEEQVREAVRRVIAFKYQYHIA